MARRPPRRSARTTCASSRSTARRSPARPSSAAVAALLAAVLAAGCDADGGGGAPAAAGARATVLRVSDGDTIRVRLASGKEERVRYIGIDTPEVGDRAECHGREARAANARLLTDRVRLEFDEEPRDRYGRLLAYVHADGVMVNAELVRDGHATPLTVPPNTRHGLELRALALEARVAGRGLWGACR